MGIHTYLCPMPYRTFLSKRPCGRACNIAWDVWRLEHFRISRQGSSCQKVFSYTTVVSYHQGNAEWRNYHLLAFAHRRTSVIFFLSNYILSLNIRPPESWQFSLGSVQEVENAHDPYAVQVVVLPLLGVRVNWTDRVDWDISVQEIEGQVVGRMSHNLCNIASLGMRYTIASGMQCL